MVVVSGASRQRPVEARALWPSDAPVSTRTVQRLCDVVVIATAATFALPVSELTAATRRCATAAFARQSAMYLAHVAFGLTFTEIGRGFRRDRRTAARACGLVEDQRDDPAVDVVLGSLEHACSALRRRLAAPVQP